MDESSEFPISTDGSTRLGRGESEDGFAAALQAAAEEVPDKHMGATLLVVHGVVLERASPTNVVRYVVEVHKGRPPVAEKDW